MTEVISFNSAVSACEKGREWQRALLVLKRLPFDDLRPSASQLQKRECQHGTGKGLSWTVNMACWAPWLCPGHKL